jgi:hypothetical protein
MYHYYGDWPRPSNIEEIYIARANLINFLVTYA